MKQVLFFFQKVLWVAIPLLGFALCTGFFAPHVKAQGVDAKAVEKMLGQFKSKGILNKDQVKAAKEKLDQITPEQWAKIRNQTQQMKQEGRVPAQETQNNVNSAAGLIDTNSPEFQKTMQDMKKILENP